MDSTGRASSCLSAGMEAEKPGLLSILWEGCGVSIFSYLDRGSLKSLRLTCKAVDGFVILDGSYLFGRTYISANFKDIETLTAMANHPRIAPCVRELVWDVSGSLDRLVDRRSREGGTTDNMGTCDRIIREYDTIMSQGLDFVALVRALPRFPGLRGVTFTELMADWIRRLHGGAVFGLGRFNPLPLLGTADFESPAMRQWSRLGNKYPVRRRDMSAPGSESLEDVDWSEIDRWAKSIVEEHHEEPPVDILGRLRRVSERGPALFLATLRVAPVKLHSYCAYTPKAERYKEASSSHQFRGVDPYSFSHFLPRDSTTQSQSGVFRSLKRLCLSMANGGALDATTDWHNSLTPVFECATGLETLELRLFKANVLPSGLLLHKFPCLKTIILERFTMTREFLEHELAPWCFSTGILTLRLVDTRFVVPDGVSEVEAFRWLLAKDIKGLYDNKEEYNSMAHSCTPNSDTQDDENSDSDFWRQPADDVDADEEDSKDGDSSDNNDEPVRFMDLQFESDLEEDDHRYWPHTPDMYSRHLDAPFCAGDPETDSEAAGILEDVYWEHYHEREFPSYDDAYEDDTPPIEDEFPMPRIGLEEALLLPQAMGENVQLHWSGAPWGYEGTVLRVLVDGFFSQEQSLANAADPDGFPHVWRSCFGL